MGRTQLSAVLMIVCAVKCLAMSYEELEDFEDYIKRTSQLSPILKKGVEADEYDVDDDVSDDAWERSGKFEGDLILNERQRKLIVENVAQGLSRNGIKDGTKRWPNGEVVFFLQVEHFTNEQIQAIHAGLDDLSRASCIKFRRYQKGDSDAVVIQGSRRGCFSQVGYQGGYQVLNLSGRHPVGRGCFRHGTIVHEMLHTLGFYHMQSSPERDDYVDVQWENIVKKAKHNFRKYNSFSVSNFGVGYDYDSVLHYSRRAFSANGQDTLVPKKRGTQIGQRTGLSDKDVQKLNRMYCDADADPITTDENSETKKKSVKNKPMDIYGIGYHQGKAVIIKVLLKGEEPKLTAVPSSYAFDHFSKAPHILSTTEKEGFPVGKKITELYEPPEPSTQEYTAPVYNKSELQKYFNEEEIKPANQDHHHDNYTKLKYMANVNFELPTKVIKEDVVSVQTLIDQSDDTTHPASIERFDRRSKIINTYVYPSQEQDLSGYKTDEENTVEYEDITDEESDESPSTAAPIKNTKPQAEEIKSTGHFINNHYDLDKHQSFKKIDNHYHPKTTVKGYYEDDSKNNKKKQELLIIAGPAYKKNKAIKYMDSFYKIPFSQYEDNFHPSSHYKPVMGKDEFEKYISKVPQRQGGSNDNFGDWHHKYTQYKYNLPNYDNRDNMDYLKPSVVRHGYHSPLGPIKIQEYLIRSPFGSDTYNHIHNQEER